MGVKLKGVKITLEVESIECNTDEKNEGISHSITEIWKEIEKIEETIKSKLS